MKVFEKSKRITDFHKLVELTQAKVHEASVAQPKELVAVKSRMGGYEMHLIDVPVGHNYVLAK